MCSDRSHFYAVILAGGEGNRLRPFLDQEKPKQFCRITHPEKSMIRQAYERMRDFLPAEHIFVSTSARLVDLVKEELPEISSGQILGEPSRKNTAPAIALATQMLVFRDPEACVLFVPSDHFISDEAAAVRSLMKALRLALKEGVLITFGVVPSFPSTDYGYLLHNKSEKIGETFRVVRFVEKPDLPTAEAYLESGDTFWNSGIFCWRGSVFLKALKKHMPGLSGLLENISLNEDRLPDQKQMADFFEQAESISVDHGIMEKVDDVVVFPFDVGWSDVGTWQGLEDLAWRFKLKLPEEMETRLKRLA